MSAVVTTVAGTLLALALASCVTVLAWHGTIDGQAAIGFFSGLGIGGVAVGAHAAGVRSGNRGTRAAVLESESRGTPRETAARVASLDGE